jgi:hypothetical protein
MDITLGEEISKFLNDENKNRKIASVKAIGQIRDARYVDKIIETLDDSDWEVRAVAARSLGKLGDNKALDSLSKSLCDKEWWVRYNSAYSIVELPGGIEVIKTVLYGEDRFAKDILISAVENSRILKNIPNDNNLLNSQHVQVLDIIKKYQINKFDRVKA